MNSTLSIDKLKSRSAKLTKQPMRASDLLGSEPFPVYWPDAVDCERALHVFAHAHLSHRVDLVDVLNAQTAIGLGATHNRKHFQAIPQLETTQPYTKN
jgi:predicted nucleic acid-binding protein